jgi:hypothetical protein
MMVLTKLNQGYVPDIERRQPSAKIRFMYFVPQTTLGPPGGPYVLVGAGSTPLLLRLSSPPG